MRILVSIIFVMFLASCIASGEKKELVKDQSMNDGALFGVGEFDITDTGRIVESEKE